MILRKIQKTTGLEGRHHKRPEGSGKLHDPLQPDRRGGMGKVKPITKKLSAQEKVVRAIRILEKRKDRLKLLIDTLRTKNTGPEKE